MNPEPPSLPDANDPASGSSGSDPGSHPPPADLDYRLVRLIGHGGYGEVWLVQDKAGVYRACKVVYRESFSHERPYEREYNGIQKFEPVSQASDSQVRILHVGRRDQAGYFYYIMELADAVEPGPAIDPERYIPRTLQSEVRQRGRLPAKDCLEIGLSLSAALENLHQHGLIHRDLKPANIIFVNGIPKLADIGLVTDAEVTVSYVGTGGFIPPEGPTSPQADIYGLGKVLYEISTGKDRLEFPELPTDLGEWPDRDLMLELNAVMAKACERDLGKRYRSARELHAELALLLDGKSVRSSRERRRKGRLAARAAFALTAIALAAAGVVYSRHNPAPVSPARPLPAEAGRIPPPESGRVVEEEAKLREKYRQSLMDATNEQKRKVANALLQAGATTTDPAIELASLRFAGSLSVEAGEYSLLTEICRQTSARFEMNVLPMKLELLTHAEPFARSGKNLVELAETCIAAGFEAITEDDYATATQVADLARRSAEHSADPHAIRQAAFFAAETTRCQREYDRIKSFAETLHQRPADARASLEVGKFLCFVKSDWQNGLPLMAHGDEDSLKSILEKELIEKPVAPHDQTTLGDAWWNRADTAPDSEKAGFRRRARYWYLKAIAGAVEPDKTWLRDHLLERIKSVPTQSGEVHLSSRVSRGENIDIYSDEIHWKSTRGSTGDKINQIPVGDLKPGNLEVIRNYGKTRTLPDDVDFSTARLTVDHRLRRRSRTELQIEADHVRVVLADPPAGSAEFEVTVTFGDQP